VFPTLRLQPFDRLIIVGTNLRRRSDSMLQRSFNRRNTLAACVPSRVRSFGFIVTPVRREAPTHRKCNSKTISTETRKLLAALGFQPRTFTSLSSPSGLTEFTARCMDVTPRLDRLMIYLGHSGDPCRDTLVARSTSLSVRYQTNLTSVSTVVLLTTARVSRRSTTLLTITHRTSTQSSTQVEIA